MKKIEFENILEDFNFLENWEDKYRYIIDLGKELQNYPEDLKNEDHRVIGCASQVWFNPKIKDVEGKKVFSFKGVPPGVGNQHLNFFTMPYYGQTKN